MASQSEGVQFIGMISARKSSEIHPPKSPVVDRDYIRRFTQAHEEAGFDRILVPYHSHDADTVLVGSYAANATERIGLMLAHRPGFVSPSLAARAFATLDQLTGGRVAIHVISGGDDAEQQRDGDFLSHDERYARTDEYVDLLRQIWISEKPIDHAGKYYRLKGAFAEVKPVQKPYVPIYFGGASDAAIEVAGKHADIYALWGETHAQVREIISRVRESAVRHGRDPQSIRFSLSFRPILAKTEAEAWERAHSIVETIKQVRGQAALGPSNGAPANTGSQRLLDAAAQGDVVDKRLFTAIARLTGARGNTTALVGTPEQVADALLDYYDLGVTTFLIRGFDPVEDAIDYGRELIPLVRELATQRAREPQSVLEAVS
jgi:alkanesulfonate monooxygenase